MSYCLNPDCRKPQNRDSVELCRYCGAKLLLKDRYRPLQPIGQGGFGRTFLAIDEDKPSKPRCVIKQFLPINQTAQHLKKAAQLFEREAMRLEELGNHPQIPSLLAYFRQEQQQYLVQEFVNGKNLAELLHDEGTFTETQVRSVLVGLLPVLGFIHAHSVIHRDIKPANLIRMAGRSPEQRPKQSDWTVRSEPQGERLEGTLALVDFGAAKAAIGTALSKTGTTIGSPEYLAPEQSRGKAVFASDLFSLGVTCIHLLTQRSPFDLFDSSDHTWIWRKYLLKPVSEALGHILDRLLEPAMNRRYQSAADVWRDLERSAAERLPCVTDAPLAVLAPLPSIAVLAQSAQPAQLPSLRAAATVAAMVEAPLPPDEGSKSRSATSARRTRKTTAWQCVHQLLQSGKVYALALSPAAPMLASSSGTTIKLWNVQTGQPLRTLTGHLDVVSCLAISPDGNVLISGSADKSIRLWDLQTGQRMGTIALHTDTVLSLALSPDGQTLASGSLYDPIKLWHLATNRELASLSGQAGRIEALAFSPDGLWLASGSNDATIALWNLNPEPSTGQRLRLLKGHTQTVAALTFEPDGKTIASGSWDGTVKRWSTRTHREKRTLQPDSGRVTALTVSQDGILCTGSETLKLWQPRTGKVLATLAGHTAVISAIALSTDSSTIASSSWDGTIRLWQRASNSGRPS